MEQIKIGVRKRGKKVSRKAGRNIVKCAYYRNVRSTRNKLRKLNRHLNIHVADDCAKAALERAQ